MEIYYLGIKIRSWKSHIQSKRKNLDRLKTDPICRQANFILSFCFFHEISLRKHFSIRLFQSKHTVLCIYQKSFQGGVMHEKQTMNYEASSCRLRQEAEEAGMGSEGFRFDDII